MAVTLVGLGRWLLALSASAAPSGELHAQAAPAPGSCAPPQSSPSAPAEQQVAALYRSFECHFARGQYAACLPYLEQACQLTDSPRCLLNLGAVHHALMHCQLARGYYHQYLDRSPYDEHVAAARSALEELERACPRAGDAAEEPAAGGAPAPHGEPAALQPVLLHPVSRRMASAAGQRPAHAAAAALDSRTSAQRQDHVLAWSLLGAGAATLTATVVLAAYGARAERDYEARASRLEPSARRADAELRAIDERGQRSNQLALGLGVLSGLLAGAGATLWLMDEWQAESGVGLAILPDGTALSSYSGRF